MLSRRERAEQAFLQGYNCAQSVMKAYEDLLPVNDREAIIRLSSSFGGGMGRLREVCGSVSGMFMVIGLLRGYSGPETGAAKAQHYARIQTLAARFEAAQGSIVCRELLGLSVQRETPVPEARTEDYYKKRPCREIIGTAAELLEQYLKEEGVLS